MEVIKPEKTEKELINCGQKIIEILKDYNLSEKYIILEALRIALEKKIANSPEKIIKKL